MGRIRRFWAWLMERDEPTVSTPATERKDTLSGTQRDMTIPEIDGMLTHFTGNLANAKDRASRIHLLTIIDGWLDARHRLTLTHQLERDYRDGSGT